MRLPFFLALATLALAAQAGNNPPPQDGGGPGQPQREGPPGPPPEALSACAGKTAGSAAQFTARDGRVIRGTCQLVLLPARNEGQGGGQGKPPAPR
ncbi:hypothetical protein [Chitinimonas koreensis]|uniref:hypothetical protein n=1 Tax=Chitinimonas koreensis TaxID=356302 RepID=UPI0004019DFD|nr:hypothetical protein [Chitinimonas koreensis]QNM95292.1 hypothetical protein H9L41_15595 [Chitinimonas koreensis]